MTRAELCRLEQAELVKLIDEGRLVYLPCKVGGKVKIDVKTWGNTFNYVTAEHGKYLLGEIVAIIRTRKQILIKIQAQHNVSWVRARRRYPMSALGITVFLIPEQAKQKLKELTK